MEKNQKDPLNKIKPVNYTADELAERSRLITVMSQARDMREMPHPEFDDMTYSQYYDTNKRADLSYIPPKKNKADKRIVTGYTREKDTTLLSALLSYDFNPDITVYNDEEMVVAEMGNHMEDIVKKSREIEQWNGIRPLIYRELISQGDVFVEEIWQCVYIPEISNDGNWTPGMPITGAKFDKKHKKRKIERAAVKLHQGKNVYVGNFFEERHDNQELVFTYELLPRGTAEAIYGTWDRWDNVPTEIDTTVLTVDGGLTYTNWNLTNITGGDYVGVLKIQEKFKNRYMIMLNGVLMLPVGFPLSEISPDGEYTIKHGVLEGINGCAYGKGQPAKTKVDQAVHDTFLRLMILREEQAGAPPMGYRGKRVLSSDIYTPGKISNNMREGDLFPILPSSTGLQNADFSMYQLIKGMIEDKTINPTFSGEQPNKQVTLGQLQMEKQQQLLKLGVNFDAVKNLEKTLVWARIGNIIMHYAKPVKEVASPDLTKIDKIYRTFSLETTLQDGRNGVKVFEFTDKAFPTVRDQMEEEKILGDYYGKKVQKVYFNGPAFIELLKYRWIVNIVPRQESSDQLEREMFVNDVREAKEIFGPMAVNDEYAKERFAIHIKEDPNRFFVPQEKIDQMMINAAGVGAAATAVDSAKSAQNAPQMA